MTDNPADAARGSRNRLLVFAGVGVVLAGLIVAGVFAASGTGPARANLEGAASTPATAAEASPAPSDAEAADAPTPDASPPLTGSGPPISVSGTDPITGETVTLDQFTGKPVVLAIWASWCPGCNDEAPHLSKVAATRTDVHFVGLNYRDDRSGAQGFYDRYGWSFPSIEDASGEIAFDLGLQGTPTTIFLDAEHREIGRILGATDAAGFEEAVDQITGS